jgi:tetratricopeptide (TPR) repeat protein
MRLDEALSHARRAAELDPLSLEVRTMEGWVLFSQRRYDEAIKVWTEVLELDPEFGLAIYNQALAYAMQNRALDVISAAQRATTVREAVGGGSTWILAVGYALSGKRDRAKEILHKLESSTPSNPATIAVVHHILGDDDTALEWLEKGYMLRSPGLPNVTSEPWFDDLRDHPRFRALRANIGLPR